MTKKAVREIVFDTETTGFDPFNPDGADRIVEIGAIELIDLKPTGRVYHQYINPERSIPAEVVKVHGIDDTRVANEPTFKEIAQDWHDFIGDDSMLVAHNAGFDMKFINAEFSWVGLSEIGKERVIDTLAMARKKFPGQRATLDALCTRYGVDNSNREFHGALLDSELLVDVYFELCGGAQHGLALADSNGKQLQNTSSVNIPKGEYREPRSHSVSEDELSKHTAFLETFITDPIWFKKS